MKKICAILILALLALLAGCALAETSTIARSGALAAYLDGEGRLYLPGNEQPVNRQSADALVSIDPYRVLFLSTQPNGTRDRYMLDLGSFQPSDHCYFRTRPTNREDVSNVWVDRLFFVWE